MRIPRRRAYVHKKPTTNVVIIPARKPGNIPPAMRGQRRLPTEPSEAGAVPAHRLHSLIAKNEVASALIATVLHDISDHYARTIRPAELDQGAIGRSVVIVPNVVDSNCCHRAYKWGDEAIRRILCGYFNGGVDWRSVAREVRLPARSPFIPDGRKTCGVARLLLPGVVLPEDRPRRVTPSAATRPVFDGLMPLTARSSKGPTPVIRTWTHLVSLSAATSAVAVSCPSGPASGRLPAR